MEDKILTKNINLPNSHKIETYENSGGYLALKKALKMESQDIIEEVKRANLRGRGGAGFPTGVKWSFLPKDRSLPRYLCVNADEGEPGTFKDRLILEKDPHLLIEGIIITSYATGVEKAFIYIRGEYNDIIPILQGAIDEAYNKGYLGENILGSSFNLTLHIHQGAGAYICGEETGLLESLEGKRGMPRLKPPFPAQIGLFNCPTIINNVETIACIPAIINNGGEWFANLGVEKNGGTKLYAVSGKVNKPGVYELPMGTNLKKIIYEYAGGIKDGKKLKAVIPGGSSSMVLRSEEIDISMDFDSLMKAGSMLGSGAIIVMDEDTCMVEMLEVLSNFYSHESCGQCTPCREGTNWIHKIVRRINEGFGREDDLDNLLDIASNIAGKTLCPMGDAAITPVVGFIKKFREEFEYHIKEKKCNLKG